MEYNNINSPIWKVNTDNITTWEEVPLRMQALSYKIVKWILQKCLYGPLWFLKGPFVEQHKISQNKYSSTFNFRQMPKHSVFC